MANHLGGYPSIYQGVTGNGVFYTNQTPQGTAVLNGKQSPKSRLVSQPQDPPGPALTPIATYFLSTSAAAGTLSTPSFTPSVDELIIVKEAGENNAVTSNPTGTNLTFAKHQEINTPSRAYAGLWSATVGVSPPPTSISITIDGPGTTLTNWSAVVERWPAGTTLGTLTITGSTGSGAPLANITTTTNNSAISWCIADWNAIAPGTPTYRNSPTQENIHDRSPSSYVAYYAYQPTTTAGAYSFGITLPTGQEWSAVGVEIIPPPTGGPTSTPVNQVTETDTPQAITSIKIKSVLQVTETDTANAVTYRKLSVVLQPSELDLAQPITRRKTKAVLQATELDTTQTVTRIKIKQVLQSVEVDVSQPVTPNMANVVNAATEADTAQTITRRKVKVVNQVVETDTPQPLRRVHQRTLGQPIETDLATTVAKRKTKTLAQALETDSVFSIKIMGRVFQTTELDTAQPIRVIKRKTLGQPAELDTVTAILKRKTRTLGQPVETNTATVVIKPGNKLVLLAGELDTAQKITAVKRKTLGQPSNGNLALLITPRRVRVRSVNVAQELDLPTTLRVIKRLTLGVIEEVNLSRIITARTELPPPPDGIIISVVVKPITVDVTIAEGNDIIQKVYYADVTLSGYDITVNL